ncbi:peptidase C14, caspase domain-containing protein [Abortiporus biennis]|nr:peptidase C14, caspase domain-containing protein [Abortiporus biennis]
MAPVASVLVKSPSCYAILIALRYQSESNVAHSDVAELPFTHRDARRVAKYLVEEEGYLKANIVFVMDSNEEGVIKPTLENVLKVFDDLGAKLKRGDRCTLFMSGHGAQDEVFLLQGSDRHPMTDEGRPLDRSESYSTNPEYRRRMKTILVDNEIRERLIKRLPDGVWLTAILDSCHSATLLDLNHYYCNFIPLEWCSKPEQSGGQRSRSDTPPAAVQSLRPRSQRSSSFDRPISLTKGNNLPTKAVPRICSRRQTSYHSIPSCTSMVEQNSSFDLALQSSKNGSGFGTPSGPWYIDEEARRCGSPVPIVENKLKPIEYERECIGLCTETTPIGAPHIKSLAATCDWGIAWDTKESGVTFASTLLDILESHKKTGGITLRSLVREVGQRMCKHQEPLQILIDRAKREKALNIEKGKSTSSEIERVINCGYKKPVPVLGGMSKLNLDETFHF